MLPRSLERLLDVDLVLHAGDVTEPAVLDALGRHAPVRVALGNQDSPGVASWGAEPEVRAEAGGAEIAMVHDAGPSRGRERRLRRRFPTARLVVFGHSHIPLVAEAEGAVLLNPGSPTWKRRQPAPTAALVQIRSGRVSARIVALG